jgi:hypothetical protein
MVRIVSDGARDVFAGPASIRRIAMRTLILIFAAAVCYAAQPAEGRWEGTLEIPGTPLTAVIDLAKTAGEWAGSATIPGFVKGAQLGELVVQPTAISFVVKGVLGEPKLTGRVDSDGTFTGEFVQAGNRAPFHLRKSGPPQVDLPRQSTAVSPELQGEWQGEFTLNGTPLKASLKLANEQGKATAQFVVTGKRETKVPVDLVRQEGDFVSIGSSQFHMSWEGRWRKDANQLSGTFAQGPMETPLLFARKP